ncbi:nucleotidyltransferase domain-containing protein [Microlunatus elymi]|uniref:Nucleotidyltransferase domain-containing protein n=1 Tax=Microlunatus elymi TaxID=2596828 RepID=A0A516PVY1_9ACTN|nr:nucleotidyltransferase domain-containing protein [Microlunatus elymi]QDP95333.1 nucleotidyltransferase domain-containing protein [Microlunatus elymi]
MTPNVDHNTPVPGLEGLDNGLDEHGRIRREGDINRVDAAFAPLVAEAASALRQLLDRRLHSIYLYGSIPRGTAVVGQSDLDMEVVLHSEPTETDRTAIGRLAAELDQDTDLVNEVGIIVAGRPRLLSAAERYDNAFQISCLCTPLWGPDLADELPDQYPSIELARHITSGTQAAFTRLTAALNEPTTSRPDFIRQRVGRRITRLAYTCVLFRWPGWTSDPITMQRVITAFYPGHTDEVAASIRLGWGRLTGNPPDTLDDHHKAVELLTNSAPWWTSEHHRVTAQTG